MTRAWPPAAGAHDTQESPNGACGGHALTCSAYDARPGDVLGHLRTRHDARAAPFTGLYGHLDRLPPRVAPHCCAVGPGATRISSWRPSRARIALRLDSRGPGTPYKLSGIEKHKLFFWVPSPPTCLPSYLSHMDHTCSPHALTSSKSLGPEAGMLAGVLGQRGALSGGSPAAWSDGAISLSPLGDA